MTQGFGNEPGDSSNGSHRGTCKSEAATTPEH